MIDPYPRILRLSLIMAGVMFAVAVPLAALLRGGIGALTALGALAVVVLPFMASILGLRWASPRGPATVQAVALGGLLAKLVVYALLIVTVAPLGVVDEPTLAVTAPLAIILLLIAEVRLILKNPEFRMLHDTPEWANREKEPA